MDTAAFLTLRHGRLRCTVCPALGGSITGLWLGELALMPAMPSAAVVQHRTAAQPPQALDLAQQAASYPLVPYSNRIGYGQLDWGGVRHQLPLNAAPEPHPLHGVGWQRPWVVQACSDTRVQLHLHHAPDAAWPWGFESRQTLALEDGVLSLALEITNTAPVPAPVGLGWHPYFVKRADTRLDFQARGRWEMGADQLPTAWRAHPGLQQATQGLEVDHCFDGWDGTLSLHDSRVHITLESACERLVVYTTAQQDCIALEPVSHSNNALQWAAQHPGSAEQVGVRVLQPGQSFGSSMRITAKEAV